MRADNGAWPVLLRRLVNAAIEPSMLPELERSDLIRFRPIVLVFVIPAPSEYSSGSRVLVLVVVAAARPLARARPS